MLDALKTLLSPSVLSDGQLIDRGDYRLRLRVNARARRISLRIDARNGEVVAVAPQLSRLKDALAFADTRHEWILTHNAAAPAVEHFRPDLTIPFRGRMIRLVRVEKGVTARLDDETGTLSVSGDETLFARRIERFLRAEALKIATQDTRAYAEKLGFSDVKISLFDATGRWGSCTPGRRTIRLSWRLVMAPPQVFAYVCAHEAAHLKHPDHSPRFWAQVHDLFGEYGPSRRWLKTQGQPLFAYSSERR